MSKKDINSLTDEILKFIADKYEQTSDDDMDNCNLVEDWNNDDDNVDDDKVDNEDDVEDNNENDDVNDDENDGDEDSDEDDPLDFSIPPYEFFFTANFNPIETSMFFRIESLMIEEGLRLHTNLVVRSNEEEDTFRAVIRMRKSSKRIEKIITPEDIKLNDGVVHLTDVLITDLLDDDYALDKGSGDMIYFELFKEDEDESIHLNRLSIDGPWPSGHITPCLDRVMMNIVKPVNLMSALSEITGWGNLKSRISDMLDRSKIGRKRQEMGLPGNAPILHTLLIGNNGTGKSSAAYFLARVYSMLGFLKFHEVHRISLANMCSMTLSGEYEIVMDAVMRASGETLVFENAHLLFRQEAKPHDTEGNIVRALVDALEDKKRFPCWMLVLTGDPAGMEQLMAAYPSLRNKFSAPIYMEDFTPSEMLEITEKCEHDYGLEFTEEAQLKLKTYISQRHNQCSPDIQNAWLIHKMFNDSIIPAMYKRLGIVENPTTEQLRTVMPEDIPTLADSKTISMAKLDELIGLSNIKSKIYDYMYAVQLAAKRMEMGFTTNMPRLHCAFLGNPGTGKTTVAEIIGQIFASWGILSEGRVIRTEKNQMVGQWIGQTEQNMKDLLARARGNILFIDEAYQLVEDHNERDYGHIVMNSLLTELGKERQEMVVILAGYTARMQKLLESNEGIQSRFPNVFNFEDYTTDELLEIGKLMIKRQGFILTEGAEQNMRRIIKNESGSPSPLFGNGRFVSNLLQNEILATLGARIAKIERPTKEQLCTILPEDVIIGKKQKDAVFDDVAIDAALARLDSLVGLYGVKMAIHNFVQSARYLHSIGEPYVGRGLLSWRFIGKSGTGKSTVARIMATILKGMRLITNSHITEVKGERIFGVSEHDCNEVLQDALKRSCNGLIFIDVDERKFSEYKSVYNSNIELIILKLKEMTAETAGECALIMAELDAPNKTMAEQLSDVGVYEFDHTLIFRDFSSDELFLILSNCLSKYNVSFSKAAESHIRKYIASLRSSIDAGARTMKLMARTIFQRVVLRESGLACPPTNHEVQLSDVEAFKWDNRKGRIGY